MWILIPIIIIVALAITLLIINSNEGNTQIETKDFYSLTELDFLKQANANEIFTTLDSGVNDELKGTYAILTKQNSEGTFDIMAINEDNSMLKIVQIEYSDWKNGINNLKQYDFIEEYIYDNAWFYVIGNNIYYFNQYTLRICNLTTEECEFQVVDLRQSSDIEIDGKKIMEDYKFIDIEKGGLR